MKTLKVDVLGTDYTIFAGEREDIELKDGFDGECRTYGKQIKVLNSISDSMGGDDLPEHEADLRTRELVVHEVCHAFINESGVSFNSDEMEEKVCDFLMKNFRKMNNVILEICEEIGVLDS